MTELWEILLPPRPDQPTYQYVGSVYAPHGAPPGQVIACAVKRFGTDALAYRRADSEGPWTFIDAEHKAALVAPLF